MAADGAADRILSEPNDDPRHAANSKSFSTSFMDKVNQSFSDLTNTIKSTIIPPNIGSEREDDQVIQNDGQSKQPIKTQPRVSFLNGTNFEAGKKPVPISRRRRCLSPQKTVQNEKPVLDPNSPHADWSHHNLTIGQSSLHEETFNIEESYKHLKQNTTHFTPSSII